MRKLLFVILIPLALVLAGPATAATAVSITNSGFQPAQVTIGSGDTVTWTNNDTVNRQIVADGGAFSSPQIRPGDDFSFRFTRAATYAYHDQAKTAQKGTVVVRATGARSVTIAAGARSIILGSTVELSGSVTGGQRSGQQLIVVGKPYRGPETRTPALTESDGSWSVRVRPRIRTEYKVEWGNTVSSTEPIVYVRPAVQLRVLNARTGRLYAKVTALVPYKGKLITLQRLRGSTWVKVRRARLASGSVARFTARLPRTARIRLLVPTAPGYLQGYSRTALVRR
jgi:plastocyanin